MIDIKSFAKRRNSTATVSTSSSSSSSSNSSSSSTTNPESSFFYYNNDTGFVVCRYDLCSVGNIVAMGSDTSYSGGSSGGGSTVQVVDNLTSYSTTYALSANQGRVIKHLIDNITTYSGGQQFTGTIDWSNVTNKPYTFTPTSHTHAINDVNGLQSQIGSLQTQISGVDSALATHANNTSIHLNTSEKTLIDTLTPEMIQFLTKLMNTLTIDNSGNCTFNGNVNSKMNVTAMN